MLEVKASVNIEFEMKRNKRYRNFVRKSVDRFLFFDWGDISEKDKIINEQALEYPYLFTVGIYKNKKFGDILIYGNVFKESDILVYELEEHPKYKIKRSFEGIII